MQSRAAPSEMVPLGHTEQPGPDPEERKRPGAQSVHVAEPARALWPRLQGLQIVLPFCATTESSGQSRHLICAGADV